jgi:hypothetical protein
MQFSLFKELGPLEGPIGEDGSVFIWGLQVLGSWKGTIRMVDIWFHSRRVSRYKGNKISLLMIHCRSWVQPAFN